MLRITEIFLSIQGESTTVGLPTVFVRLTGCPLRCRYCDTAYAFSGGQTMSQDDVVAEVVRYGIPRVTVTGGEPLAQVSCRQLLTALCDKGFAVSLETSGALSIAELDRRVTTVMDLKTPSSGEHRRNLITNLAHLRRDDEIKFVISDRADYDWTKATLIEHDLTARAKVLLSPSHGELHPRDLAEWMLADALPVRLQVQLHKYLWGDEPGR
jgi:7-carboxy-7-deazaguanine synthase